MDGPPSGPNVRRAPLDGTRGRRTGRPLRCAAAPTSGSPGVLRGRRRSGAGDEALLNRISLIPVNPRKCPKANLKESMIFVKWLTDPQKGQKIIQAFGVKEYGSPMFFPDSTPWRKSRGIK